MSLKTHLHLLYTVFQALGSDAFAQAIYHNGKAKGARFAQLADKQLLPVYALQGQSHTPFLQLKIQGLLISLLREQSQ